VPSADGRISAVIFDLFGTLVAAPTAADRAAVTACLADLTGHGWLGADSRLAGEAEGRASDHRVRWSPTWRMA